MYADAAIRVVSGKRNAHSKCCPEWAPHWRTQVQQPPALQAEQKPRLLSLASQAFQGHQNNCPQSPFRSDGGKRDRSAAGVTVGRSAAEERRRRLMPAVRRSDTPAAEREGVRPSLSLRLSLRHGRSGARRGERVRRPSARSPSIPALSRSNTVFSRSLAALATHPCRSCAHSCYFHAPGCVLVGCACMWYVAARREA